MVPSERLIEIVKKYPALYDAVHPDYGDVVLKARIWAKIAAIFRTDPARVEDIWTNLKRSYLRYAQYVDKSKIPLSRGYGYLRWVKMMEYFKPFIQVTENPPVDFPLLGNTDSSDVSTTFSEEMLQKPKIRGRKDVPNKSAPASISHPSSSKKLETQSTATDVSVSTSGDRSPCKYPNQEDDKTKFRSDEYSSVQTITVGDPFGSWTGMDALELIFLGYAKTVKTFSSIRQTYTKMKIAQIIMEQEIQHLDENPNSSVSVPSSQGDRRQGRRWSSVQQKPTKDKIQNRRYATEIVKLM